MRPWNMVQAEMDTNWREQEATNNEWDKRMRKVEAVIAGLPAWKEDTVNLIRENKRSDDTRYAEVSMTWAALVGGGPSDFTRRRQRRRLTRGGACCRCWGGCGTLRTTTPS